MKVMRGIDREVEVDVTARDMAEQMGLNKPGSSSPHRRGGHGPRSQPRPYPGAPPPAFPWGSPPSPHDGGGGGGGGGESPPPSSQWQNWQQPVQQQPRQWLEEEQQQQPRQQQQELEQQQQEKEQQRQEQPQQQEQQEQEEFAHDDDLSKGDRDHDDPVTRAGGVVGAGAGTAAGMAPPVAVLPPFSSRERALVGASEGQLEHPEALSIDGEDGNGCVEDKIERREEEDVGYRRMGVEVGAGAGAGAVETESTALRDEGSTVVVAAEY